MQVILEFWAYMSANWYGILIAGGAILTAAELVVRLTPTANDDAFVQRIANVYNKLFELLKVPNIKREEGKIIIPAGQHPDRKKKLTLTGAEKK